MLTDEKTKRVQSLNSFGFNPRISVLEINLIALSSVFIDSIILFKVLFTNKIVSQLLCTRRFSNRHSSLSSVSKFLAVSFHNIGQCTLQMRLRYSAYQQNSLD